MTTKQIRQSFIDFFKSKQHTHVPSSSLLPTSPGLLFTNSGMNQFVPYFLGKENPTFKPPRAVNSQKCIRAGGKHNDLEDVGVDSYHQTYFEMLGNWSFGDYFKTEAIHWAWELLVEKWNFPPERLYATVYQPAKNDPAEFDSESAEIWQKIFAKHKLDPQKHVLGFDKKDNFWMMGETGPCGPCSEIHIDLTSNGDSNGKFVNANRPDCIEIWNLVFIQLNANPDGTFSKLPKRHVDTGMGFERICAIIKNTDNFTNFGKKKLIANYDTDLFQPIIAKLEKISQKKYQAIFPENKNHYTQTETESIAFRAIADHIRTLVFAIADGILPGNNGRNYVIRRILRRTIRHAKSLEIEKPFLAELFQTLLKNYGKDFPELQNQSQQIQQTLKNEEENFSSTLERGTQLFKQKITEINSQNPNAKELPADFAFQLYDTYGFPLDLTQMMAREKKLTVDAKEFDKLMERQRATARKALKKEVVSAEKITSKIVTEFVGYDTLKCEATLHEIITSGAQTFAIVDKSPFYAEMGGQIGDTGCLTFGDEFIEVTDTKKIGETFALEIFVSKDMNISKIKTPLRVNLELAPKKRRRIEAHHTATHLLHWALHQVVGESATQQGSLVSYDRLRFDFNSQALTSAQIAELEKLVNEKIYEAGEVSATEVPYNSVKGRADIMQFFGEKYSERVRVVQIGGEASKLNGFSMELCAGTHVRNTNEIGLFKIKSEGAIASGIRRIEAVCGLTAVSYINAELQERSQKNHELQESLIELKKQHEKFRKKYTQEKVQSVIGGMLKNPDKNFVFTLSAGESAELLGECLNQLKAKKFSGAAAFLQKDQTSKKIHIGVFVGKSAQKDKNLNAGEVVKAVVPIINGKGGGSPEMARGAGSDFSRLSECEEELKDIFFSA